MAKYHEQTRYGISDLTDMEWSVLAGGLAVLATQGEESRYRYPEYKQRALELLDTVNPALAKQLRKDADGG